MMEPDLYELSQQQNAIASWLTNHSPAIEAAQELQRFGLTPHWLAGQQDILLKKRISQTLMLTPLTARSLGQEYRTWFERFASTHHFNSTDAIRLDAMYFTAWLQKEHKSPPAWLADCLRFDAHRLSWASTNRTFVKFQRTRFNILHWPVQQPFPEPQKGVLIFLNVAPIFGMGAMRTIRRFRLI
jgi:hypothetical protein